MSDAQFAIGDDVFVRNPKRFDPTATCILGVIDAAELRGGARFYRFKNIGFPAGNDVWHREADLGLRPGTPLSQISGRPGHRGYEEFCRIANSWGYP
jgi:hypothetical protein